MTGPEKYLAAFAAQMDPRKERDPRKSREGRDAGMQAAVDGATPEWKHAARAAVRRVAAEMAEFTTDDVWATDLPMPREPRALGPIMNSLAKEGLIEITDRTRTTVRAVAHAGPKRVWRSLIHG